MTAVTDKLVVVSIRDGLLEQLGEGWGIFEAHEFF